MNYWYSQHSFRAQVAHLIIVRGKRDWHNRTVITGNMIIVMGGYDGENKTFLSSVECLDLSTNEWRELAPMTKNELMQRAYAVLF